MRIGELSRRSGVSRDTIRHYVTLGLLLPGRDAANHYQLFDDRCLSRLRFIRSAKSLGLQLADIQAIFADAEERDSPCPRVRELMENRVRETRHRIAELQALCDRMESAMESWREMPDRSPNGTSVCHLIESQAPDDSQSDMNTDGGQVHDH